MVKTIFVLHLYSLCTINQVLVGHLCSLMYNFFRWKATRLFNYLLNYIEDSSSCSTLIFKERQIPIIHRRRYIQVKYQLCGYTCGGYLVVTYPTISLIEHIEVSVTVLYTVVYFNLK